MRGRQVQRSHPRLVVVVLIIAGLQASACTQKPDTASKSKPATVERLQGTDRSRVILSAKAAERLDLKTAPVRVAQVARKRMVGGEVVAVPAVEGADRSRLRVRVRLSPAELRSVARDQPARVLHLARDGDNGVTARLVDDNADKDMETGKSVVGDHKEAQGVPLYYLADSAEPALVPGQRVRVELPLSGNGMPRKVVPYSAVLYDLHGETWVYTSPEPLVFVRHPVRIDYIEGELAVLSEGPPSDTEVVTVGAGELFGAETGIGM